MQTDDIVTSQIGISYVEICTSFTNCLLIMLESKQLLINFHSISKLQLVSPKKQFHSDYVGTEVRMPLGLTLYCRLMPDPYISVTSYNSC